MNRWQWFVITITCALISFNLSIAFHSLSKSVLWFVAVALVFASSGFYYMLQARNA